MTPDLCDHPYVHSENAPFFHSENACRGSVISGPAALVSASGSSSAPAALENASHGSSTSEPETLAAAVPLLVLLRQKLRNQMQASVHTSVVALRVPSAWKAIPGLASQNLVIPQAVLLEMQGQGKALATEDLEQTNPVLLPKPRP